MEPCSMCAWVCLNASKEIHAPVYSVCKAKDTVFLWNKIAAGTASGLLHFFTYSQPNKTWLHQYLGELRWKRKEGANKACSMSTLLVKQSYFLETTQNQQSFPALVAPYLCREFSVIWGASEPAWTMEQCCLKPGIILNQCMTQSLGASWAGKLVLFHGKFASILNWNLVFASHFTGKHLHSPQLVISTGSSLFYAQH